MHIHVDDSFPFHAHGPSKPLYLLVEAPDPQIDGIVPIDYQARENDGRAGRSRPEGFQETAQTTSCFFRLVVLYAVVGAGVDGKDVRLVFFSRRLPARLDLVDPEAPPALMLIVQKVSGFPGSDEADVEPVPLEHLEERLPVAALVGGADAVCD